MRSDGYLGAQRASDHADHADHADRADRAGHGPLWSRIAYVRALEYLVERGRGATFTTEAMSAWAEEHHTPPPPDGRAWGNITRKLARKNLIRDTERRVETANKRAHGREVVLWAVA